MSEVYELLGSPIVVAIGWALLHLVWQGAIVVAIAAALLALLTKGSANARYLVACGALLTLVILGAATAVQVYEPHSSPEQVRTGTSAALYVPTTVTEVVATSAGSWREVPKMLIRPIVPWAFALWLAGVLLLTLRLAGGWLRVQRFCRVASEASEPLQRTVRRLSATMHLDRAVRVVASTSFDVPVVVGWLRPVLLFPVTALSGLTPLQVETIVAHELAHVRRHDYLVNLMQTFVETLLFYHPAVWWLSSRIRAEREHCCDDVVVATCGNAVLYARALTDLEALRSHSTGPAMAATGGSLRTRVVRLIAGHHGAPAHRLVSGLALGAAILSVTVIAPLSLLAHQRQTRAEKAGSTITVEGSADVTRLDAKARPKNLVAGLLFDDDRDVPRPEAPPVPEDSGSHPGVPAVPAVPPPSLPPELAYAFKAGDLDFDFDFEVNGVTIEAIQDGVREGVASLHGPKRKARKLSDGPLTIDDLVHLKAAGVTSAYIESLAKAGYTDLTIDELAQMSVHDLDAAWISSINGAGYGRLSADRLLAARIHDLTPEFVQESRRLLGDLPFDDLLALQIHDVSAEKIEALEKAFGKLKVDSLVALTIHDVDRKYLDALAAAGIKGINAEQAIALAAVGVDAEYVAALGGAGLENLSVTDLVKMKAIGIDADYVRDLAKEKAKRK